jgi:hypothetical protein
MSASATADSIRLTTASGGAVEARLVLYGDRFGPNGRYVNEGRPVVEFKRCDVSPSIAYINSFQLEYVGSIKRDVRFSPDGTLPNALPLAEVERLLAWLDDHGAAAYGAPAYDGDDELI